MRRSALPPHADPALARAWQADAPTQDTLTRLATLPGLNLVHGLKALRRQPEKYLRLLARFVELHAPDMDRLRACLASGDAAAARQLVHALRGVAATLGAEEIAIHAGWLDEALRADPAGPRVADEQAAEMQAILEGFAALRSALAVDDAAGAATD